VLNRRAKTGALFLPRGARNDSKTYSLDALVADVADGATTASVSICSPFSAKKRKTWFSKAQANELADRRGPSVGKQASRKRERRSSARFGDETVYGIRPGKPHPRSAAKSSRHSGHRQCLITAPVVGFRRLTWSAELWGFYSLDSAPTASPNEHGAARFLLSSLPAKN